MKKILIIFAIIIALPGLTISQDDAVYNKLIKEYTLNEDGSSEYHLYKEVTIISYYAFNRQQGETFIVYNPEYQELNINDSYTIMADGKKIITPLNAYNEVLPRFASHITQYNNLREMVITHTGLERGATVFLDYTLHTNADFLPASMNEIEIPQEADVKEMIIKVNVPENKTLNYRTYNIRTSPEVEVVEGMKVYKWTFRNLKPSSWERNIPPEKTPQIIYSAAKDLKRVYFSFVGQEAFTFQISPEMGRFAESIAIEEKDEIKLIRRIQSFVVNDLATFHMPLYYTGYNIRTPEEVWNSNGGTQIEKAILMTALLLNADVNAVPIAVIPDALYDEKIGCLMCMQEFVIQVNTKEHNRWYFSSTKMNSQDLAYDLTGKTMLVLDGAIESLKKYNVESKFSKVFLNGGFVIKDTGNIVGTFVMELENGANPYFDLLESEDNAKKFISGISSKEFVKVNNKELIESKSVFTMEFEKSGTLQRRGDYIFWSLPYCTKGISSWHIAYLSDLIEENFKIPELIKESYEYSISIPENYDLILPAGQNEISNELGKVSVSIEKKEQEVIVIREIELKQQIIGRNQYKEFKRMMEMFSGKNYKELIFRINN